jgi:hypothetical protein
MAFHSGIWSTLGKININQLKNGLFTILSLSTNFLVPVDEAHLASSVHF